MASSRTFLLLGLMFAVVILIFSDVSARELAETTNPPSLTGGKGGAVSCNRPGELCHGRGQKGNPEREHCKHNPTSRQCHRNGGHERGGEEDPIHKRHGHEHGGVAVEPIHGGKGHGHERGGEGNPKPGAHCKPGENNRACYRHGGHERGGEQDPIHKGHGHEHGGVVVEPIHRGKGHGHERVGEGDPRNKRPGQPGTTETKTKN
ncbi:glycine-rich protein DC9.1-like isoform X1 [Prunus avium]|uniref:Glycine-rich protein DC9.1-like isoform X1 n=1 Tax=Prunus avium TaxID=42229 RepID=A0A6P5S9T3_PRUAV|nr:glycine-rich protein DC9.1-like isoform X1 [Prunus avium]